MTFTTFGRALTIALASVILGGCGGAQTVTSTLPQGAQQAHKASGTYGDLIYVTTTKAVVMLTYPDGKVVGTIPWQGTSLDSSICSDPNTGNVFIPEGSGSSDSKIYEYAHGATTPMTTLSLPPGDSEPNGCAVDPTTGNLALIVWTPPTNQNAFLVYPGGAGTPVTYVDKKSSGLFYAAYDDSGDLFSFSGRFGLSIGEVRRGSSKFNYLRLANCEGCSWSKLVWDGTYLTLAYFGNSQTAIGRLATGRKKATLVNTIQLKDFSNSDGFFWLFNGSVISKYQTLRIGKNQGVGLWPYPAGGNLTARFHGVTKGKDDYISDFTVSVAPTRK